METSIIHSIPFLGGKTSVKDDIFSILSEEPSLTAKEIHARIKRKQGKDVTYQAVHKTITKLAKENVLSRTNGKYSIRKEWVSQVKDYLFLMEDSILERPNPSKILRDIKNGPVIIHFSSLTEMGVFTAQMLINYREQVGHPIPHSVIIRHGWMPLKFDLTHFALFKKMDDNNPDNRTIIIKSSPFDQWIEKFYRLSNATDKMMWGKSIPWEEDIMVRENLVIQVNYSKDTIRKIDTIYNRIHGLQELFLAYFVNGEKDDGFDIDMTISINPAMAKLFREKVKGYFGEK